MASPASTKGAFDHAEVNNWITTVFAPDRLDDTHRPDDGRSRPWISQEVPVRGFTYDVSTGRLSAGFPDGETVTGW